MLRRQRSRCGHLLARADARRWRGCAAIVEDKRCRGVPGPPQRWRSARPCWSRRPSRCCCRRFGKSMSHRHCRTAPHTPAVRPPLKHTPPPRRSDQSHDHRPALPVGDAQLANKSASFASPSTKVFRNPSFVENSPAFTPSDFCTAASSSGNRAAIEHRSPNPLDGPRPTNQRDQVSDVLSGSAVLNQIRL